MNRPPTPVPRRGPWPVFLLLLFALGLPSLRAGNPAAPAVALPPLLAAAERGELAAVRSALDAGVPVDTRDGRGWTALIVAANAGRAEVARLLLERRADPDARTAAGCVAVSFAALGGHLAVVDLLLAAGAHPDLACQSGNDPVTSAVSGGSTEVLRHLLARGAPVNGFPTTDDEGHTWSRLIWAAVHDQPGMIGILLDAGAQLEARNNRGDTVLMEACKREHVDVVQTLLDRGADPRARGPRGHTALHYAAYNGRDAIVELLLAHGADPRARATDGEPGDEKTDGYTPERLARQEDHPELAARLAEAALTPPAEALAAALARGDVYSAQTALKRGAPAAGVPGAPPPLFAALAAGDPVLVGMLLDAGADPNARDAAGRTPLAAALVNARAAVGTLPRTVPATDLLRGQHQAIIDRLHQAGARECPEG